jgi:hypothetical protein
VAVVRPQHSSPSASLHTLDRLQTGTAAPSNAPCCKVPNKHQIKTALQAIPTTAHHCVMSHTIQKVKVTQTQKDRQGDITRGPQCDGHTEAETKRVTLPHRCCSIPKLAWPKASMRQPNCSKEIAESQTAAAAEARALPLRRGRTRRCE